MPFIKTPIKDLLVFEPKVFEDSRGYFFESYNQNTFLEAGITRPFVQDNQSYSSYGVLRGLHLQKGDAAQAKLVRVIKGKVLDVAVDLRKDSSTFKQSYTIELSDTNKKQLYVPRGFAHGFVVLSETAEFFYKCDNFYVKDAEVGVIWNDEELKIDWFLPEKDLIISEKDIILKPLNEAIDCL